jgi:uncharacterized iron-regulated protein
MHILSRSLILMILPLLLFAGLCHGENVLRAKDGGVIPFGQLITEIKNSRVILIGEDHQSMTDHWRQIKIMKSLNDLRVPLTIGLEMFTARDQSVLDDWVSGRIDEGAFAERYYENWREPWPMYRDIFLFAQRHRITMVGLNLPREVTRKVAEEGYASLTGEERKLVPDAVTCKVDTPYLALVRRAFAVHGMSESGFVHFCEAQMLWNRSMAWNIVEYLKKEPNRTLVVLAGKGHAMKEAIPTEILKERSMDIRVILSEDQLFTRHNLSPSVTDFLFPR